MAVKELSWKFFRLSRIFTVNAVCAAVSVKLAARHALRRDVLIDFAAVLVLGIENGSATYLVLVFGKPHFVVFSKDVIDNGFHLRKNKIFRYFYHVLAEIYIGAVARNLRISEWLMKLGDHVEQSEGTGESLHPAASPFL